MKKTVLLLVMCLILAGCGEATSVGKTVDLSDSANEVVTNEEPVKLYYPDENATGLTVEEFAIAEKTPEAVLEALFENDKAMLFGKGTKLLGFELVAGEATVDVSGEFLESSGDFLAIYSIVNTLTEFEEISFVRITVEGSENAALGNFILSESFTRNESLMK